MKLITVLLTLILLDFNTASQEDNDEHAQHCGMTSAADNNTGNDSLILYSLGLCSFA